MSVSGGSQLCDEIDEYERNSSETIEEEEKKRVPGTGHVTSLLTNNLLL